MATTNLGSTSKLDLDKMMQTILKAPPAFPIEQIMMNRRGKSFLTGMVNLSAPSVQEFRDDFATFAGVKVVVNDFIPPLEEIDWSGCRSPSRAKRRLAQGHPQRTKVKRTEVAYLVSNSFGRHFDEMAYRMLMEGKLCR